MNKIYFLSLALCLSSHADTEIEKYESSINRLRIPEKVTVGPNDNYQFTVSPDQRKIVFSQKNNLNSNLIQMTLADSRETLVLEEGVEAKDPQFSPNGKNLVFTQFKRKSLGSVCIRNLEEKKQNCISDENHEVGQGFWFSDLEVGFVKKSLNSRSSELWKLNIKSKEAAVLFKGLFWSPSYDRHSNSVFFVGKMKPQQAPSIWQLHLGNQSKTRLRIDMPGASAFPRVSKNGKTLYFNHYFSDTNHDQVIDAADNSVIFQIATADIKKLMIVPIQLTSSEMSCSQPLEVLNSIYTTCAFEGSVDVYKIPQYGQIPIRWSKDYLENAQSSARTYEERVMILNNLRHRFNSPSISVYYRSMLANHILASDLAAARFYAQRLAKLDRKKKQFYNNLLIYLEARNLQIGLSNREVTPRFKRLIRSKISNLSGRSLERKIIEGTLNSYIGKYSSAKRLLESNTKITRQDPIVHYLYFKLALELKVAGKFKPIDREYKRAINAKAFSMESRLYYAFQWLLSTQGKIKEPEKRIDAIVSFSKDIEDTKIKRLFDIEIEVLKLVLLSTEERVKNMANLNLAIAKIRSDYLLRKVVFTRSILTSVEFDAYTLTRVMASNWLKYTPRNSTEFGYARDIFSFTVLDRAYEQFAKKNVKSASNSFYQSVAISDNLEAHFGYVATMLDQNEKKRMDLIYDDLLKRNIINENIKYVNALLSSPKEALKILKDMKTAEPSAMKQLLIGSLELELLLDSADGYLWDKEQAIRIHRTLSLAADLGRDNKRILASAWNNLGLLHSRTQNYGYAVKYYRKYEAIGFASRTQESRFRWNYAKALFMNNRSSDAADQIRLGYPEKGSNQWAEKEAFYRMYAEQYREAVSLYKSMNSSKLSTYNKSKWNLNLGFSLFKLKQFDEAKKHLTKAISLNSTLKPKTGKLIAFDPVRINIIANGLLAQIEPRNTLFLKNRLTSLEEIKGRLEQVVKTPVDWYSDRVKSHLQIAYRTENRTEAINHIDAAISTALESGKQLEQFASPFHRKAVFAGLIDSIEHTQSVDPGRLEALVTAVEKSQNEIKTKTPFVIYESTKLKLLKRAYHTKKSKIAMEISDITQVADEEIGKKRLRKKWLQLKKMAAVLTQ